MADAAARIAQAAAAISAVISAVIWLGAAAHAGEPMNLADARPRAVSVRFETSPPEEPGRLASSYTEPLPAWLEPLGPSLIQVTIAGREIERGYLHRRRPLPGSFSDYVWTFDATTGDVIRAQLSGTLVRKLEVGPLIRDIDTPFEVLLSTLGMAGFEAPRSVLGQLVFAHCARRGDGCTLVQAQAYDQRSGYVNAVGPLVGRALGMAMRTFAPMGEAIFSEVALHTASRETAR
jgi:hypothetical protein